MNNDFTDLEDNPIPGVCVVCGCTDERGCPEGCFWVNRDNTLCSVCGDKLGVIVAKPRAVK
jgi:hypothetical protein